MSMQDAWAVIEEMAARLSYGEDITGEDLMMYDQALMITERSEHE